MSPPRNAFKPGNLPEFDIAQCAVGLSMRRGEPTSRGNGRNGGGGGVVVASVPQIGERRGGEEGRKGESNAGNWSNGEKSSVFQN